MFTQQLINGLALGAVYALIALGYTMVYGILQLINFAHGEVYMLGAYLGIIVLGVLTALGLPSFSLVLTIVITLAVSMLFCASYGATIERLAYRPLRKADRLSPLISAVGMSTFLQNYVMLTQGKDKLDFPSAFRDLLTKVKFEFLGASVNLLEVFIVLVSIALMVGLHLFVTRATLGKAMRATSQDKKMAGLSGIDVDRVISVTFVVGSSLAAAAGLMVSMYEVSTRYDRGYMIGLKAFTAAVLGGIGNIPGAMLGGFLLGLVESVGVWQLSPDYKDVYAFAVLIIVLVARPTGLLGERVAEKV